MSAKKENLPLLKWIQDEVHSSGTDQIFEYIFNIGKNSEFQIRLQGGQLGNSEPDEMLANLADYKTINIQLFESPRAEPRSLDNLELWRVETLPIFPNTDYRFSGQPWAKDWGISKSLTGATSTVSYLMASPDTICDIIRYCGRITGLKAFW